MNEDLQERVLAYLLRFPSAFESASSHLKATWWSEGFLRDTYNLIRIIWKKTRTVPKARELRAFVRKMTATFPVLERQEYLSRAELLYSLDVTEATRLELARFAASAALLDRVSQISDSDTDPLDIAADLRRELEDLTPLLTPQAQFAKVFNPLAGEHLAERKTRLTTIPQKLVRFGWKRLDECAGGGLLPGELAIVMANSGFGKTACMISMVVNMLTAGERVLFCSLDNVISLLELRLYARITDVAMNTPVALDVYHQDIAAWRTLNNISENALHVYDIEPRQVTVAYLRSLARSVIEKHGGLDVIFVDYGDQLKADTPSRDSKRHDLADVFEDLRSMAKALGVVVITATQANRRNMGKERSAVDFVHSEENLGEAYAKIFPATLCVTINQSEYERKHTPPLCRLNVLKSTKGERDVTMPFVSDYKVSHFYPDTYGYYTTLQNQNTATGKASTGNNGGAAAYTMATNKYPTKAKYKPKGDILEEPMEYANSD